MEKEAGAMLSQMEFQTYRAQLFCRFQIVAFVKLFPMIEETILNWKKNVKIIARCFVETPLHFPNFLGSGLVHKVVNIDAIERDFSSKSLSRSKLSIGIISNLKSQKRRNNYNTLTVTGVVSNFGVSTGTGVGTSAQDTSKITFSEREAS